MDREHVKGAADKAEGAIKVATSESFRFVVGFRSARVLCRPLAVSCPPHTSEACTISTSDLISDRDRSTQQLARGKP